MSPRPLLDAARSIRTPETPWRPVRPERDA
jgi:hypothetical protein